MEAFGKLLVFVQYTTVFGRLLIRSYYQDRNALKIGALSRGSGCFQQIARFRPTATCSRTGARSLAVSAGGEYVKGISAIPLSFSFLRTPLLGSVCVCSGR